MGKQTLWGGHNFQRGDLPGSDTVSGPSAGEADVLIERAAGVAPPVDIGNGESRAFRNRPARQCDDHVRGSRTLKRTVSGLAVSAHLA